MSTNDGSGWVVSTGMMMCLFGTNFLLYVFFQVIQRLPTGRFVYDQVLDTDEDEDEKKGGTAIQKAGSKKMSEPFVGNLECFTNLTAELFSAGNILALTYICEKHWYTDHLGKVYDRDLFMFVLLVFFGYAYLTTKKTDDLSFLGVDQTLEWKGWMQFIFLLYHYFHAEEVYNSVRVMITCYVWMTGYGQFSSFYTKQDFGWLKVSHNLWRLNFAVLLLMWTHGNSYILYYICPMHTFYFLMVYATMYVYSSVNHQKWGIRYKLLALGLIIYIVWDINGGMFDFLFAWLGTDSVVGATNGSVWEYYFRTSLDHWSSYLGMIFALNYPMADQFFNKVRGWPLVGTSIVMGALSVWWYLYFYTQGKMSYNLTHSYFAVVPLTAYIFFRNINPSIRRYVSYSLVDLGKTTLETYLLQHHIWLTSNAKTLLNITPGYPWVNFFLASTLFVVCAKELYRITTSLRAMILPDEKFPDSKTLAIKNMAGIIVALVVCLAVSAVLSTMEATLLECALSCLGLFLACLLVISRFSKSVGNNATFQLWLPRASYAAVALLVAGIIVQLSYSGMMPAPAPPPTFVRRHVSCLDHISHGKWVASKCPSISTAPGGENKAFCETDSWVWEPLTADELSAASTTGLTPSCPVGKVSSTLAKAAFKNKRVVFAGDSILRNTYHALNGLLDAQYRFNASVSFRHGNLQQIVKASNSNTSTTFYWAPFVSNITTLVQSFQGRYDLLVCGAAAWDALYIRSPTAYKGQLLSLSNQLQGLAGSALHRSSSAVSVWIQPTTIVDNRLTTIEKQQYIGEKTMQTYRELYSSSPARSAFGVTIDPTGASRAREGATVDGVHYSEDVYKVIAQLCVNAYTLHFPQLYIKPTVGRKVGKPKATGPMSFPSYGLLVLIAAGVMLYTMDAFFGVSWFMMRVLGVTDQQAADMTWDSAYREVHRKNHISHPGVGLELGSGSGSRGGGDGGGSASSRGPVHLTSSNNSHGSEGGSGSRGGSAGGVGGGSSVSRSGSERGGDSDREDSPLSHGEAPGPRS